MNTPLDASTRVFVGLGSNLDNPLAHVTQAITDIAELPQTTVVGTSNIYRSTAIGQANQPDYINAALEISTTLSPEALLDALQSIENKHQRIRSVRWGPRTLDLDILLYGAYTCATERLSIPHPEICNRNFVVQPLLDLDARLCLPDGRILANILPIIGLDGLTRLDDISLTAGMAE